MIALSGMTESALLVLMLLFLIPLLVIYFLILYALKRFGYGNLTDTHWKKLLWFIASGVFFYLVLYLHFEITGKGLL